MTIPWREAQGQAVRLLVHNMWFHVRSRKNPNTRRLHLCNVCCQCEKWNAQIAVVYYGVLYCCPCLSALDFLQSLRGIALLYKMMQHVGTALLCAFEALLAKPSAQKSKCWNRCRSLGFPQSLQPGCKSQVKATTVSSVSLVQYVQCMKSEISRKGCHLAQQILMLTNSNKWYVLPYIVLPWSTYT